MNISNLKNNAFLKVMSLNSISVIVKMIAGLVSVKVVSVLLGPSALALLGNFKNLKNAVKSFATLGVQNGVVKYTSEHINNEEERKTVYSTAFFMMLFSSVFLGLVSVIASRSIGAYLFKTEEYQICIIFFGALLPLYGFQIFSVAVINGLKKFRALVVLSIIASVLALLITVGLIWFYKTLGALLALSIIESVIVVFYIVFFLKEGIVLRDLKWSSVSKKYARSLSSYSIMTFTTALVFPFSMLFLRNLIIGDFGLEEAGLWEAVNRMSDYYLMILTSGITMYYLPKLAGIHSDAGFRKEIGSYFKTFMPLCLLVFLLVFLFREIIVNTIFSHEFLKIKEVLLYQLIGDFFKIASYAFAQQFLAKRLTKEYVVTEVLFFVIYLSLSLVLIEDYGIKGVLISYLVSYVGYFLMMLLCFRKQLFRTVVPNL